MSTGHPAWCNDHGARHQGYIVVRRYWHEALRQIDDSVRIEIRETPAGKVTISHNMQDASPDEARRVARLILDAADEIAQVEANA
jgi:DNA-binding IclR family transcriptional regulator